MGRAACLASLETSTLRTHHTCGMAGSGCEAEHNRARVWRTPQQPARSLNVPGQHGTRPAPRQECCQTLRCGPVDVQAEGKGAASRCLGEVGRAEPALPLQTSPAGHCAQSVLMARWARSSPPQTRRPGSAADAGSFGFPLLVPSQLDSQGWPAAQESSGSSSPATGSTGRWQSCGRDGGAQQGMERDG